MFPISFTIIIPSHNCPELLRRCLDSIPDIRDIQVIVVDDNSDPNIVDFNKYPGLERENTVVVFSKEGKGAGYARNIGLAQARGKWVLFADSDDFYNHDFINIIYHHYNDEEDIVFFDVTSVISDNMEPSDRHLSRSVPLNNYKGKKLNQFCRYLYTEPWGKMFKGDFLKRIDARFDESFVANDYYFSIYTGFNASKISVSIEKLYCVTERKGSLSNSFSGDLKRLEARLKVYNKVQKFYENNNIRLYPLFEIISHIYIRKPDYRKLLITFCKDNNIKLHKIIVGYIKGQILRYLK